MAKKKLETPRVLTDYEQAEVDFNQSNENLEIALSEWAKMVTLDADLLDVDVNIFLLLTVFQLDEIFNALSDFTIEMEIRKRMRIRMNEMTIELRKASLASQVNILLLENAELVASN